VLPASCSGGAGDGRTRLVDRQGPYAWPIMPVAVTVVITLALVFYTVGVWSERIQGRLKPWHLAMFVAGLVFDTVGTGMMFDLAGGLTWDLHGLSGLLAIVLMFVHAAWAAVVLWRRDEAWLTRFHRFSVVVWLVWLVPYVSPMFFALGG